MSSPTSLDIAQTELQLGALERVASRLGEIETERDARKVTVLIHESLSELVSVITSIRRTRDTLIREALAGGAPTRAISQATGLTRARLQQIAPGVAAGASPPRATARPEMSSYRAPALRDREYLTEGELADLLGLSSQTLKRWRAKGTGPPHVRFGRKVRYESRAVAHWISRTQR